VFALSYYGKIMIEDRKVDCMTENETHTISNGNDDDSPHQDNKKITRDELIDQLQAQVDHFEKLPDHVRFSPVLHADLYYFMLIILNILKRE
jgi:hypothetical protein